MTPQKAGEGSEKNFRGQRDAGPELLSYYLQTNFISTLRVSDRCPYG